MSDTLRITLVKSMIGRPEKHRKVLAGMGLRKLNRTVELEDTPSVRGMIRKVSHLVSVSVEENRDEVA
jgi:large subunit ribosomal protein L30